MNRKVKYLIGQLLSILFLIYIISISSFYSYLHNSSLTLKYFLESKGSYTTLRLSDPIARAAIEAKSILPTGSPIDFSPDDWVWEHVVARYYLYPMNNIDPDNWLYFIDFDNSKDLDFASYDAVELSNGIKIYNRSGAPLSTNLQESNQTQNNSLRALVVFCFISLLNIIPGASILIYLKIMRTKAGLLWWLSTAYLLGFFLLTGILWLFMIFGGRLNRINLLLLWSVFLLMIVLWTYLKRKDWVRQVTQSMKFKFQSIKRINPLTGFIIFTTNLIIISIIISTVLRPVRSWDAMSHWIYKAKAFHYHESLDFTGQGHNIYPILWPLNIASQFTLLGESDSDELAKWTAGLLYLVFIVQFLGATKLIGIRRYWGWFALFVFSIGTSLLSSNNLSAFVNTAYAEAAFLAFFCAAVAAGIGALERPENRNSYIGLTALLSFGLTSVKLEGLPTSIIIGFGLTLALFLSTHSKGAWMYLGLFSLPGIIQNLSWKAWLSSAGFQADSGQIQSLAFNTILSKIVPLLNAFQDTSQFYSLLFGFTLAILLLNIYNSWRYSEIFLAIVVIGLFLFSFIGLIGWSTEEIINNSQTAMGRLMFHAIPALTILIASRGFKIVESQFPSKEFQ